MTTTVTTSSRINDIVARQRSSRLRDLSFSLVLAIGVVFGVGALRAAAAQASAPAASAPAVTAPASTASAPICYDAASYC